MMPLSENSTAIADWPDGLIDVLERQRALVEELASMSRLQAGLIAERRTDRLLELLSRRQIVIDEFTVCQAQMSAMSHDLDRRLSGVAPPRRDRIRGLIGGIGERLREVMQRDHEDQAAMHGGREALLGEISGLGNVRQARAAYGPAPTNVNRFADRQV
jgi:hypothetical protein